MKRKYFAILKVSINVLLFLFLLSISGCGGGGTGVVSTINPSLNTPQTGETPVIPIGTPTTPVPGETPSNVTPSQTPQNTPNPYQPVNNPLSNQVTGIIGFSGGTLVVNSQSNPLYGIKIDVPQGAVPSNTNFSINTTYFTPALPLQQGYLPAGETISLGINSFLNKIVTLTIPVNPSYNLDDIIIVAYDETTNSWVVPMIAGEDTNLHTIKVIINHTIVTDNNLRAQNNDFATKYFNTFKALYYDDIFNTKVKTKFYLSTDDFHASNYGSYLDQYGCPNGACWGFTCFSKWYFENIKPGNNIMLFNAYDKEKGTKVACEAQNSQINICTVLEAAIIGSYDYTLGDKIMAKALIHDLNLTKKPIVLALFDKNDILGPSHAVLLTGYESACFNLYDPSNVGFHSGSIEYQNEQLETKLDWTNSYNGYCFFESSIIMLNDEMRNVYNNNPIQPPNPDPNTGAWNPIIHK